MIFKYSIGLCVVNLVAIFKGDQELYLASKFFMYVLNDNLQSN